MEVSEIQRCRPRQTFMLPCNVWYFVFCVHSCLGCDECFHLVESELTCDSNHPYKLIIRWNGQRKRTKANSLGNPRWNFYYKLYVHLLIVYQSTPYLAFSYPSSNYRLTKACLSILVFPFTSSTSTRPSPFNYLTGLTSSPLIQLMDNQILPLNKFPIISRPVILTVL